jgi:hypothetical protein
MSCIVHVFSVQHCNMLAAWPPTTHAITRACRNMHGCCQSWLCAGDAVGRWGVYLHQCGEGAFPYGGPFFAFYTLGPLRLWHLGDLSGKMIRGFSRLFDHWNVQPSGTMFGVMALHR